MAEIECDVEYIDIENDRGGTTSGVKVTCTECGHSTESFGTKSNSVRRCLVLLKEECPENQRNFYTAEEDDGSQ